jgi:hypothetical protein
LCCSWGLDTLSKRTVEANRPSAVQRAASTAAVSPRIKAVGGAEAENSSELEVLAVLSGAVEALTREQPCFGA